MDVYSVVVPGRRGRCRLGSDLGRTLFDLSTRRRALESSSAEVAGWLPGKQHRWTKAPHRSRIRSLISTSRRTRAASTSIAPSARSDSTAWYRTRECCQRRAAHQAWRGPMHFEVERQPDPAAVRVRPSQGRRMRARTPVHVQPPGSMRRRASRPSNNASAACSHRPSAPARARSGGARYNAAQRVRTSAGDDRAASVGTCCGLHRRQEGIGARHVICHGSSDPDDALN